MNDLGAMRPTRTPRATDHIQQMISMVVRLIAAGHAYVADGHVLFSVPSMLDYGALSRHSRDALIAGARVEVAPYKKDPADFVLWKPSTPDQPGWWSPWGFGRPGWHIECSAMSETYLGTTFDIHGGGQDLIFPHHENEIAQSVCAHDGAPFVRYWMHNGYVTVEGEKMSKSLGNFYTVRQLLEDGWDGETIRLALLTAHYRQPLDFSKHALTEAKTQLDRLYGALRGATDIEATGDDLGEGLLAALMDDLNTPRALAELHQHATILNGAKDAVEKNLAKSEILTGGSILGILRKDPDEWFKTRRSVGVSLTLSRRIEPTDDWIHEMIDKRMKARSQKNFQEADNIRNELANFGIIVEDKPDGSTNWRRE